MKKDLKSALGKSLKEETKAVEKRFAQADIVFKQSKTEVNPSNMPDMSEEKEKLQEVKIEKVIRDSFTLPSEDYQLIELIKKRALKASVSVTKSEVIRAGLLALQSMSEEDLVKVINSLTKVKSGRRSLVNNL